ncbi:MAG TPA: zinc-ribbon domain-containing protein [Ktedonobacterales bacterium]|jgi:hypothetical protein
MQSGFCSNCGEPLAPNAAFCPNCGAKVAAPAPNQVVTPLPLPPTAGLNATVRASAPPAGDFPPAFGGDPTVQAPPPVGDAYAAQYAPPPPSSFSQYGSTPPASGLQNQFAPPSVYAPGPPPPATPGGVAPWAQPQKSRGRRNILLVLVIAVVLIAACGGGAYALLHAKSKGSTAGSGTPGTNKTPGTSTTSTPAATSTAAKSGTSQKLDNINRIGVYGGVMITILSATQSKSVPDDFQNFNPDQDDILKIIANIDFEGFSYSGFFATHRITGTDGRLIDRGLGHGNPKDEVPDTFRDPVQLTNDVFYFEVPNTVKITDWTLVVGDPSEERLEIPLSGNYDPTAYQEIPHTMGLNQPIKYDNGNITGVITKIVTVLWNPCGCQAPKGMRFLRVYFHVTNNTALPVNVGDGIPPQYVLIYPNGDRSQADTRHNAAIAVTVNGGESKDVGFDSWVIPQTPAPYQMVFLNPDGSTAGMVDFGTL